MGWRTPLPVGILCGTMHVPLAWLLAVVVSPYPAGEFSRPPDRRVDLVVDGEPRDAEAFIAFGAAEYTYWVRPPLGPSTLVLERHWGWPRHCLRASFDATLARQTNAFVITTTDDRTRNPRLPNSLRGPRYGAVVPITPIWPGVVINTILFWTVAAGLAYGVLRGRAELRMKRGRCPTCRYPASTAAICSECGTALPYRARRLCAGPPDRVVGDPALDREPARAT